MTWISGWISGSPPAIETIGAPHSSTAPTACATGIRRRSSCSGCWILPQPEQARLHWNSGSSSTIRGNFSRLASRCRIRYQPMRVLCLTRTDMPATLVAGAPVVKGVVDRAPFVQGAGHPSQRAGSAQRLDHGANTEQLVRGAVEHDPHDPERPPAGAAAQPHRLHVDRDRALRPELLAALADGDPRDAYDRTGPELQAAARELLHELGREVAAHGPLRIVLVGCRVDPLGNDHFAGHRRALEPATEADDEDGSGPLPRQQRRGGPCPLGTHAGLAHDGTARGRGDQGGLDPQGRREEDRRHGRRRASAGTPLAASGALPAAAAEAGSPTPSRAARAAACPLRTALSSVAGQPVAVQVPASTRPGTDVAGPGRSEATPGLARNVAACSRVTRKLSTWAPRARGSSRSSSGTYIARSSSTLILISRSAPDSDTARYWQPAGTPPAAVRSNRYWTGLSTPAAKRCSHTVRS